MTNRTHTQMHNGTVYCTRSLIASCDKKDP